MATKDELLAKARELGLKVTSHMKKSDVEATLSNRESASNKMNARTQNQDKPSEPKTPVQDEVVVNENVNGEATSGTTLDGSTDPVKNTDSIPQNDVSEIKTTPHSDLPPSSREVAKAADEARTSGELAFANESNPNRKGRSASAKGETHDQDGNLRTDGYSYGVAPDDPSTTPDGGTNNKKDQ